MNQQRRQMMWILWGALLVSQPVMALAAIVSAGKSPADLDLGNVFASLEGGITPVLLGIGVAFAVASAIVPKIIARSSNNPFAPFIVGLAMCEACTVMGFVAAMGPPAVPERVLLPAAIAIVVMVVVHAPTGDKR